MSNTSYVNDSPLVMSTIVWSVKQIIKMVENGTVSMSNIIQRSFVWDVMRMSLLIHSILYGFPVPVFWANKVDGVNEKGKAIKIYDLLDGKQRITTLCKFVKGEFALTNVPPIMFEDEMFELEGKKFEDLPEDMQETILAYSLTVKSYDNMSDDQKRELFKRLNNGKPLSTKEKNIANCLDILSVSELANHSFFDSVLTDKAKESRKAIPLVVKMSEMLTKSASEISFESKVFNETMEKVELSDVVKANIRKTLDKALAVYNLFGDDAKGAKRKFVSETNFISLVPYIWKAEEQGISDQLFADFVKSIFTGKVSVSDRYASAARAASAKTSSIMARDEELAQAWAEFFKADEEEIATDDTTVAESETETAEEKTVVEEKYYYGMRMRGASPSCQPDGFDEIKEDPTGKYYNILVYSRRLTEEEEHEYELDHLYD